MLLYTVGFAQKSAERFFTLLRDHEVKHLVDVRLRPNGQLSGFARGNDLAYFLPALSECAYMHNPLLAPTTEILDDYRKNKDWQAYVRRFDALMEQRNVPSALDPVLFASAPCCLLCSEPTPEQCHRRLVAERIARSWVGIDVVHL